MKSLDWHNRFLEQSLWTIEARKHILKDIQILEKPKILEIGSGTGVILNQTEEMTNSKVIGLDINWKNLRINKNLIPDQNIICADGYKIPLLSNHFELVFCHYLLLWVYDPIAMLNEIKRVVQKGGWICCFAEPDYLGRIDFPDELKEIGLEQNLGLEKQGVRLDTGRHLVSWLKNSGLSNIRWGILGSHQIESSKRETNAKEWMITKNDLTHHFLPNQIANAEKQYFHIQEEGSQIIFIPTFYAYAQVK